MNDYIDVRRSILKLLSHWYYFLIIGFVIGVLSVVYLKIAPKVYKARASVLMKKERTDDPTGKEFLKGMALFTAQTTMEDEIGIISSYDMVNRAVRELDFGITYYSKDRLRRRELYGNNPYKVTIDSTVSQIVDLPLWVKRIGERSYHLRARANKVRHYNFLTGEEGFESREVNIDTVMRFDKPYRERNLSFIVSLDPALLAGGQEYYFVIHSLSDVGTHYKEGLTIAPLSMESNIAELTIKGEVPLKMTTFLNKLMEVYLDNEVQKKNQLGLRTIMFIDNQLSGVSDSLRQVEGWLETFRLKNNIQDINSTAENLTKTLDRLETEKAELEVKMKYYTSVGKSIDDGRFGDIVAPSTLNLDDPLLSNVLIELSKLNQERAGLDYNTRRENPVAEVIDLKIRNTKKTLKENVENIINISMIGLNDLNSRIDRIRRELGRLPKNERELVNIQRRFDFSDNVYNYLLEKRAEAGIAIASNTSDKSVVDHAMIVGGGPVSPSHRMIYIVALLLAIVVPVGIIVVKDFWRDRLVTAEDVEGSTPIPLIGTIFHASRQEASTIAGEKRSALSECFQSLRVNLQYITLGKKKSVIGFTSAGPGEGKTFCAVNLAASIAGSGARTLLLDADMRRPSISRYFQVDNKKGLSSYLVSLCTLDEIITPTRIRGLDVIPSGPIPPNPLNLLGLPQMESLIARLRETYDAIIIDAPPVGYVAEYIILKQFTDANLFVVRSDHTGRSDLGSIGRLFREKKISNISILLNDVRANGLNGYRYGYYRALQAAG